MKYRMLGRTGVSVSRFCLGTMMFGVMGNRDHDECVRIMHRALDAGVNFVDTADAYSGGECEEIVAKALAGRRDEVVLATKVFHPMGADRNMRGNSRRWITRALEDSLRRLGTDHLDLYQLHRFDETVDIEESMGALDDAVRAGKVRMIGHSMWPVERIVEAQWTAERTGSTRFRCEQASYSILKRRIERSVLPTCDRYGMGVITYSPLAGSWLSGRYRSIDDVPETSRLTMMAKRWGLDIDTPANRARLEATLALQDLADAAGLPLAHLATAWAMEHPQVTSVIIGPRTMDQLEDLLTCAELRLDPDLLDAIDAIVAPGTDVVEEDPSVDPPSLQARNRRRPL
ncbi:MAG: aldo/keto reductase [Acidobacteria bacterium]|nr:aldo/keto reductase [Acidobacteriota bacterium]